MYDRGNRDYEPRKVNKIYVSNLTIDTTEDDLRKTFDRYGSIQEITVKQKDTISFAFIQYKSTEQAQEAVNEANGKEINGNQIRVQYAKSKNQRGGFNDRGRGRSFGDRGDRGGYQNRGGFDNNRPRRDFNDRGGDRPRGCFNCGQEGHMIKDCPKQRKPRQFNNNREGGRGGYNREDRGGYNREDRGGYNRNNQDRGYNRNYRKKSDSGSKSRERRSRS